MSTRSQITVQGQPIKVYKHCDGYPDGVLPWLVPALKHFIASRGWDETYMIARIVAAFAVDEERERAEYCREEPEKAKRYGYDKPNCLSLGLDLEWHGDIEWAYIVERRETGPVLAVYEVRRDSRRDFEPSPKSLERTIPLT